MTNHWESDPIDDRNLMLHLDFGPIALGLADLLNQSSGYPENSKMHRLFLPDRQFYRIHVKVNQNL